jgi:hypothetical protein
MVPSVATEKIPGDTTATLRLVAQCVNHYATPGAVMEYIRNYFQIPQRIINIPRNIARIFPAMIPSHFLQAGDLRNTGVVHYLER